MLDTRHLCPGCMSRWEDTKKPCPRCGFSWETGEPGGKELPPFTVLGGRYLLGKRIGAGGFGISYIALDLTEESLLAVKEFFPTGMAQRKGAEVVPEEDADEEDYQRARESFRREAELLARFAGTEGIVTYRDYLEENETAYLVMDYVEGPNLKQTLRERGRPFTQEEALELMKPILLAVDAMHRKWIIHRDISPENLIRKPDGTLTLIDFGAAREFSFAEQENLTVIVKRGYAPEEQYHSGSRQGPWTDLYACCAVLYQLVSGILPQDAAGRREGDELVPLKDLKDLQVTEAFSDAVAKGMTISAADRYPSIRELMQDLYPEEEEVCAAEGKIMPRLEAEAETGVKSEPEPEPESELGPEPASELEPASQPNPGKEPQPQPPAGMTSAEEASAGETSTGGTSSGKRHFPFVPIAAGAAVLLLLALAFGLDWFGLRKTDGALETAQTQAEASESSSEQPEEAGAEAAEDAQAGENTQDAQASGTAEEPPAAGQNSDETEETGQQEALPLIYGNVQEDGATWINTAVKSYQSIPDASGALDWEIAAELSSEYTFSAEEITVSTTYDGTDGTFSSFWLYDTEGRKVLGEQAGERQEFEYQGDTGVSRTYDEAGNVTATEELQYEDGRLVSCDYEAYAPELGQNVMEHTEMEYLEDGSQVETVTTSYEKETFYGVTTSYYTAKGSLTKRTMELFYGDGSKETASYEYSFQPDEDGRAGSMLETYTDPQGQVGLKVTEYTYDEYGNQLTDYTWSAQSGYGTLNSYIYSEFAPDKNGVFQPTGRTSGTAEPKLPESLPQE